MKVLGEKNEWRKAAKSLDQDMKNFCWLFRLRDRIDEFHEMVLEVLLWEGLIETAVRENRVRDSDREALNDAIRSLNTHVEKIQKYGQVATICEFRRELDLA